MRVESTILLPYSSILVGVGMFRVATLNDVDGGTVEGRAGTGLFETSFRSHLFAREGL